MTKISSSFMHATALAILLGGIALAQPLPAFAQDDNADTAGASSAAPASQAQPVATHDRAAMEVEKRIKTLHDKLKITAAEENDWNAVAQTMRDNETSMHQLIMERHENGAGMTAVDDLQSYQKIMQAHADGLTKMISAFQTLYADMPADQQKNADAVFGSFEGRHGKKMHGKKHHA